MIVSSHCVSGAEQKGSQETWKNITFGLRGRTSRQRSNHTDTDFKKGGLWGSNEMTVAILITTSRPSVCDAIVWQAQPMRYRGIGQRSRKIEGKRKKDDLRSQIPEGAVRQRIQRQCDWQRCQTSHYWILGRSQRRAVFVHRKSMQCVLDGIGGDRRSTQDNGDNNWNQSVSR